MFLLEKVLVFVRSYAHDHIIFMNPASHTCTWRKCRCVAMNKESNPAEHLLLDKWDFAKFLPNPLRKFFAISHLARPKLTVARVTEAGYDIGFVVQVGVYRSEVNIYFRVHILHGFDALWRSDKADELDLLHAPIF